MPLWIDEIAPGVVAMLDARMLSNDGRVLRSDYNHSIDTKVRPYICIAVNGDECGWVPVSSQQFYSAGRYERLLIKPEWKRGTGLGWMAVEQYLQDGRKLLTGPCSAFARASHREKPLVGERPSITSEGLAAIISQLEIHACMEEARMREAALVHR